MSCGNLIGVTYVLFTIKPVYSSYKTLHRYWSEDMDSVKLVLVGCSLFLSLTLCRAWTEHKRLTHDTLEGIASEIIESNPNKNLVVSPFAFRFPLCKMAAAAKGGAKQELMGILGFENEDEIKQCFMSIINQVRQLTESDLLLVNKIYVNYTDDIKNQFIQDAESYGVTVSKIGFHYPQAAVSYVNREFDSKSLKRIKDVLEPKDIDQNSSIVLANGIHFKPTWEEGFKLKNTYKRLFHHGNKTSQVLMMNSIAQLSYVEDDSEMFRAINMNLAHYGVTMTFVVPYPTVEITSLLSTISRNTNFVENLRKRMTWKLVNVLLPRFKIKSCVDWTHHLKQNGLALTTNNTITDLNSILNTNTGYNMYLSKAKQKIFLDVSESGMRAIQKGETPPYEEDELKQYVSGSLPEFVADKPFYFSANMIAHNSNSFFELVSGVYYGPE